MANSRNWGGARPGAGRKSEATRAAQLANRAIVLSVVTAEDISEIARAMIEKAKAGDTQAFRAFMSYVLGSPATEITVKGEESAPLQIEVVYVDSQPSEKAA